MTGRPLPLRLPIFRVKMGVYGCHLFRFWVWVWFVFVLLFKSAENTWDGTIPTPYVKHCHRMLPNIDMFVERLSVDDLSSV